MATILPITKAREELTSLVKRANKDREEFIITVNGSPAAVLVSFDKYESMKKS